MSTYHRDELLPEWEPVPWDMANDAANEQERGFHERASKLITWTAIPFKNFPDSGLFNEPKDWLMKIDAAHYATCDGEDLLLIDNTWFGWPDPPRWGLVSRLSGKNDLQWTHWGHFSNLPLQWQVPEPKS